MSDETNQVRPYKADGIEEYDNALPRWWVWLFNLTIVFSVAYLAWLHVFNGETIQQEYARKVAEVEAAKTSTAASAGGAGGPSDGQWVAEGKAAYATNCTPCHGAAGEGIVGPNLTDKFWIHGGKPDQIEKVIAEGVLEKGMPAWKPVVGETKVKQIAAYVESLKGTNPPNGKAPQGEPEQP